ncbi:hypothetical protein FC83_GL001910 [Agrilactobacillus composti DSM 18527 = JCM 14202]|uniref:UvrD-like helicase ATP-binding domain-containing protein n=2 Tax=Agrilactobacillus TaxID=2767875 RepID=X0PSX9_9LACO|nr:hypothetical protein FC83_GL001910 [Agrilactobacillus composti DSM 18527 = JCM 14202]GAF41047.1 ATP-dependent DNA helicase Rep [Agrilactobacillus composti DSM 18527 = JCM 14202]
MQVDFNAEQAHLTTIYQYLVAEIARLTAKLAALQQQGRQLKQSFSSDTSLNFETISDNLDTFASIEANNRQIDALNAQVDQANMRLQAAHLLKPQAYFARVDLVFDSDTPEAFYLGKVGFSGVDETNLIYDWRAPVADVYYANRLGATSYQANGRQIPVTLTKRRQFVIQGSNLLQAFDNQVAINDPVLLAALAVNRSGQMQDITATIQAEQNAIIRANAAQVLLVDGVAGSGKTSVLLQRVAYLLYQQRQTWSAENILIFTPNQVFAKYIQNVLPALGESNPVTLPFVRYFQQLGQRFGWSLPDATGRFKLLDQQLQQVVVNVDVLTHLFQDDLGQRYFQQTDPQQPLLRRLQVILRRLADKPSTAAGDLTAWLSQVDWATILKIAGPLTVTEQFYILLRLQNYHQDNIAALFIDEAQDYTPDQLTLINQLFPKASLTLVGDHNQVLKATGATLAEMAASFDQRPLVQKYLVTSYRATATITDFFAQFADNPKALKIQSIQSQGQQPQIYEQLSLATLVQELTSTSTGQLLGVITPDNQTAQQVLVALKPSLAQVTGLTGDSPKLPTSGVVVLPLAVAKGLEFDQVVLTDFATSFYQDPILGQHRRYVAASRATKTLTIINRLTGLPTSKASTGD